MATAGGTKSPGRIPISPADYCVKCKGTGCVCDSCGEHADECTAISKRTGMQKVRADHEFDPTDCRDCGGLGKR